MFALLLLLVIQGNKDQKEFLADKNTNKLEASYTTRMLLNQEISPGYKFYEEVIDTVNNRKYSNFNSEFTRMVDRTYGPVSGSWIIRIKSDSEDYVSFLMQGDERKPQAAAISLPMVSLPNPQGGIIYVLFKQVKKLDYDIENTVGQPDVKEYGQKEPEVDVEAEAINDAPGI